MSYVHKKKNRKSDTASNEALPICCNFGIKTGWENNPGKRDIFSTDVKFSPAPKTTKSMTTAIHDLKPIQAFYIVPECKLPYAITQNLMVATQEQAISLLQ